MAGDLKALLEAVREKHKKAEEMEDGSLCDSPECGGYYPCDASKLANALEEAVEVLKAAEQAIHSEYCGRKCHPECKRVVMALASIGEALR